METFNILLVTGDRATADLIERNLLGAINARYALARADDIHAASGALENSSCDVLLLDIDGDDSDGLKAVKRLNKAYPTLPVIVIACLDAEAVAIEAVKSGAQDYLIRNNIEPRGLARAIYHSLERNRLQMRLEEAEQRAHFLATRDVLTGLTNRQAFNDRLDRAIKYSERYNLKLAVLLLDIDRFKSVNETLGHQAGDALLKEVGARLRASIRETDVVARVGGDEFLFMLLNIQEAYNAARVAEHILGAFDKPLIINGRELFLTATIGIALYPEDGTNLWTLIRNADTAMHIGKRTSHQRYKFYAADMNNRAMKRLEMEADLRQALKRKEFVLHFQPQVNGQRDRIIATEALVRWQHPTQGMVPPNDFIPLTEETGMIIGLGEWVLHEACRRNRAWQDAGYAPIRIAVNVSPRQFEQPTFVDTVKQVLQDTRLDPRWLELELTEGAVMQDADKTIEALKELKHLGCRVSIDDFGTGYSSLGYLKRFPIDMLKVDKSFVDDVPGKPDDVAIVKAILAMAQSLSLETIAEGIETAEQSTFMHGLGCNYQQGYWFYKPMPYEQMTGVLNGLGSGTDSPAAGASHPAQVKSES